MAVSFTRLPWWLWRGGGNNKEKEPVTNGSFLDTFGETVKFPSSTRIASSSSSTSRNVKKKKKWQSREQRKRRVDREYDDDDVVLVPSDGGLCSSGSESDDSDWSIGWLEPHGAEFQSDGDYDDDDSFAVLVPCYRPGCKEVVEGSNNQLMSAIKNLTNELSPEGNNFMEQWISSLQNF